jgi:uncharacterized membrane protein YjgN (DUF898 family)
MMSVIDAVPSTSSPPETPAAPKAPDGIGAARFLGSERAFFGLLARGALFLMVTLGIYRFWLATDVRRFLWGNTEIAGDSLEYSGTARELLLGFLMALALLAPVYAFFAVAFLVADWLGGISGVAGIALLALLGQFAVYRARRYRLTRTVYRGIRLYQTGSAWRFAILAGLWFCATVITLGLAWPWGQASLERYKMRHTFYGNLAGRFVGSGGRLFLRGVILWAIVIVPFVVGSVVAIALVDWPALIAVSSEGGAWEQIENSNPNIGAAFVIGVAAVGWLVLAAALLYPAFRAMVLRWWISGLRIGEMSATSRLRYGQIYKVYLRFVGYSLLFALAAAIVAALSAFIVNVLPANLREMPAGELISGVIFLGAYVVVALGYSAIYQATVTIRFWRLSFESVELAGLGELENVQARGAASSAFGEGLADALDVGGL